MANEVTVSGIQGDRKFKLRSAVLLYNGPDGGPNDVFAMLHNVERHKGGATLGPGRPATIEACADFARAIADRGAFAGFISSPMLYVGPQCTAWWRAPSVQRVWFDAEHEKADLNLGKRSAITSHPGLIFAVSDNKWRVWAVRGNERPGPDTQLYRAPYFNVWASGVICEGNVRRPDKVTSETLARFERVFFESRFTHPNDPHVKLASYKGGPYRLWRDLLDGKWKDRFPDQALISSRVTLANALKNLKD